MKVFALLIIPSMFLVCAAGETAKAQETRDSKGIIVQGGKTQKSQSRGIIVQGGKTNRGIIVQGGKTKKKKPTGS